MSHRRDCNLPQLSSYLRIKKEFSSAILNQKSKDSSLVIQLTIEEKHLLMQRRERNLHCSQKRNEFLSVIFLTFKRKAPSLVIQLHIRRERNFCLLSHEKKKIERNLHGMATQTQERKESSQKKKKRKSLEEVERKKVGRMRS